MESDSKEFRFALEAVRQASLLARQVQAELANRSLSKEDLSPVTVADFAAQALVGQLLSEAFPDDGLVAEEDSAALVALREPRSYGRPGDSILEQVAGFVARFIPSASPTTIAAWIDRGGASPEGRFWTLDPVDGTKGYLRGGQYAVALALVVDGQVQLGVLGCPNLSDAYRPDPFGQGSLVAAVRGQGTVTTSLAAPGNFERLHVSDRSAANQARILSSFESGHTDPGKTGKLLQVLGVESEPVRMDSQAKYAILASGKGDVFLRLPPPGGPIYREKIWDQAAGSLIVEEAGGRVSDLDGKALDFSAGRKLENNRGVLATNGHLHRAFVEALGQLGV